MVDIKNVDELDEWLASKPAPWSQVIASRIALRVLLLGLALEDQALEGDLTLAMVRACLVSWSANNYPAYDMRAAAVSAAKAADLAYFEGSPVISNAVNAAYSAAYSAATFERARKGAYFAAADAREMYVRILTDDAYSAAIKPAFGAISDDLSRLEAGADSRTAVRTLANSRLWPTGAPDWWEVSWRANRNILLKHNRSFKIWTDWFERRVSGGHTAFDIPGDERRKEDKWLLRKIADATDEDFWDRGAEYVNSTLTSWLEEARQRAAKNLKTGSDKSKQTDKEALPGKLQTAASPQVAVTDGKLDAGPNAEYDQPIYSGDLADLPATMRAFIGVLSKSLPTNASAFMRSSLEEYDNELRVRGTRPIVGTLKGLAQAMGREIWTSESLVASDDPADWELRDEREWGPGMGDLFRTFFNHNADLIKHFPLDEKREEILRENPIDELKASGDALIKPVSIVTSLIQGLHADNLATDELFKIIDAHEQYNVNMASLPPPPANLPSEVVTPKRRHVLMTIGFYVDLASVIASAASITAVLSPSTIVQIQAAIQQLMSFVL